MSYGAKKLVAYVVLKEGETATQEEIIRYCRDNLAKYKIPKRIIFTEQLPKSLVGKVLAVCFVRKRSGSQLLNNRAHGF